MTGVSAEALLTRQIWELSARRGLVLAALDGRCAAGKTTLALRLQALHGWPVVHMDHFFLRPEQRIPQRLAAPGGNVDYERFLEEVLLPLRQGRALQYRPFDCHTQQLAAPVQIPRSPVVVVEGAYCCHPALREHYDLRVFLTADPEEQLRRLRARNGPEGAQVFADRWIPLEERYLAAYPPEEWSHLQLTL